MKARALANGKLRAAIGGKLVLADPGDPCTDCDCESNACPFCSTQESYLLSFAGINLDTDISGLSINVYNSPGGGLAHTESVVIRTATLTRSLCVRRTAQPCIWTCWIPDPDHNIVDYGPQAVGGIDSTGRWGYGIYASMRLLARDGDPTHYKVIIELFLTVPIVVIDGAGHSPAAYRIFLAELTEADFEGCVPQEVVIDNEQEEYRAGTEDGTTGPGKNPDNMNIADAGIDGDVTIGPDACGVCDPCLYAWGDETHADRFTQFLRAEAFAPWTVGGYYGPLGIQSLAAGEARVTCLAGAMSYTTGGDFSINNSPTNRWAIYDDAGLTNLGDAPGSSTTYADQAAVEAAEADTATTVTFTGGIPKLHLIDEDYSDNSTEFTAKFWPHPPLFRICGGCTPVCELCCHTISIDLSGGASLDLECGVSEEGMWGGPPGTDHVIYVEGITAILRVYNFVADPGGTVYDEWRGPVDENCCPVIDKDQYSKTVVATSNTLTNMVCSDP